MKTTIDFGISPLFIPHERQSKNKHSKHGTDYIKQLYTLMTSVTGATACNICYLVVLSIYRIFIPDEGFEKRAFETQYR